jgi:hypothetical protein
MSNVVIQKWSINGVIVSTVFTLTTDYHVGGSWVVGVQTQGSVHACGWHTANILDVVLCVTWYVHFATTEPAFKRSVVTRITYLLTNVYLLSYVLNYLQVNVFEPLFMYCLLSTLLRLCNFLHHYILILCFAPCFLHFLYVYILPLRYL